MGQRVQRRLVQMAAGLQAVLLLVSQQRRLGLGAVGTVRLAVQKAQVDQPLLGRAQRIVIAIQPGGFFGGRRRLLREGEGAQQQGQQQGQGFQRAASEHRKDASKVVVIAIIASYRAALVTGKRL